MSDRVPFDPANPAGPFASSQPETPELPLDQEEQDLSTAGEPEQDQNEASDDPEQAQYPPIDPNVYVAALARAEAAETLFAHTVQQTQGQKVGVARQQLGAVVANGRNQFALAEAELVRRANDLEPEQYRGFLNQLHAARTSFEHRAVSAAHEFETTLAADRDIGRADGMFTNWLAQQHGLSPQEAVELSQYHRDIRHEAAALIAQRRQVNGAQTQAQRAQQNARLRQQNAGRLPGSGRGAAPKGIEPGSRAHLAHLLGMRYS